MLVILLSLLAAFLFALGSALQQSAAMGESDDDALRFRLLLRLLRRPRWVGGIACDLTGFAVQVVALRIGELVVVQPLLVTTLVFALPIGARVSGQRVGSREIRGAIIVALGLVLYLSFVRPESTGVHAATTDWLAGGVLAAVIVGGLGLAGAQTRGGMRAALLGVGAGLMFGIASALTKAVVDLPDLHPLAIALDWHVYALAVFGLLGMVFAQSALQAGALAPALAAIVAFDPIAAGAVGLGLMGEQLNPTTLGVFGALGGAGLMFFGISELSQSSPAVRALHAQDG